MSGFTATPLRFSEKVIRFLTVGITVGVCMHTECLTQCHIVILCLKLPHRDRNGSGFFHFSF